MNRTNPRALGARDGGGIQQSKFLIFHVHHTSFGEFRQDTRSKCPQRVVGRRTIPRLEGFTRKRLIRPLRSIRRALRELAQPCLPHPSDHRPTKRLGHEVDGRRPKQSSPQAPRGLGSQSTKFSNFVQFQVARSFVVSFYSTLFLLSVFPERAISGMTCVKYGARIYCLGALVFPYAE